MRGSRRAEKLPTWAFDGLVLGNYSQKFMPAASSVHISTGTGWAASPEAVTWDAPLWLGLHTHD